MHIKKTIVNRKFGIVDIIILLAIASILYLIISSGSLSERSGDTLAISTNISDLPGYVLKSVGRMTAAYILSFIFTIIYGYTAAHNKNAEKVMIPLLDILQSLPVLSFLPAVVLGLIKLFPHSNFGLELSCIILIFTGQAWNMTFSFYHSIKSIPKDFNYAARIFGLNKWQNFKKLQMPVSVIGLVFNSIMSWAGGWFFLMVCEMFTLRGKDFRLPGIGSFLQIAANEQNYRALMWGIAALVFVIVLMYVLIWRPITVWSDKFKMELTQSGEEQHSFVLTFFRRSVIVEFFIDKILKVVFEKVNTAIDQFFIKYYRKPKSRNKVGNGIGKWIFRIIICAIIVYCTANAVLLLKNLSMYELLEVVPAAVYTFLRVISAQIIALMWTVPLGVAIGMNKKAANILQPVIQVVASIPATALFPVILIFFVNKLGGLNIASIVLMLMGTQWYILFNVIAGASAIPEDLKEASTIYGIRGWKKWKTLIIPSIFPYLVTGMVTAAGGCWNASIVSEYVNFGGKVLTTKGLGSLISTATERGNYPMLLLGTIVMCTFVVCINNIVWKRLYALSDDKFKIEL